MTESHSPAAPTSTDPLLDPAGLAAEVEWPDNDAERAARENRLPPGPGRPLSPYGRLAGLAEWMAGTQRRFPPQPPTAARLVVVGGHHVGAAARTLDDATTALAAVRDGTLPAVGLAASRGVRVELIDAGEVGEVDVDDAAMTTQILAAIDAGARLADGLVDAGADLLVLTAVSPGASTTAAAVICVLTLTEPTGVVGRGSGVDDAGWAHKTAAIRDARRRGLPFRGDLPALLAAVGGTDLAYLVGLLLRAAGRATPVLLDGVSAAAAALVAREATPRITRWIRLAHRSTEPAEALAAQRLGLEPLLDLGLTGVGVTAGIGGLLALDTLQMAAMAALAPASLGVVSA